VHYAILFAIIVLAHTIETVTGFGCTVVALALGAYFVPVDQWVITLVMVAWLQSAWLVGRGFRHIHWRLLGMRILPCCALGMPFGFWLFTSAAPHTLKMVLGLFVIAVSGNELLRLHQGHHDGAPLPQTVGCAVLVGGGLFHGLFASGGPLVVYFASRAIRDKATFRATLSLLWLVLGAALLVTYAWSGRLAKGPAIMAAKLVPALVVGIIIGEMLHHRVNELTFRKVVQGLLCLTGLFLLF